MSSAASTAVQATAMRRATWASVATATLLIAIKLAAYFVTGSVALLSSLVDSGVDLVASTLNLIAVRHALEPADRQHRFGHGKAEPLAGLGQAAFIAGSAAFLVIEAASRLFHPAPIEHATVGVAVMAVSITLTAALVAYQRRAVRVSGSIAVRADLLHYWGDILVNAGIIAALVVASSTGWWLVDPLVAIAVAAYIVHSAWSIIRQSVDQLMDRELPPAERRRIRDIALAHPEVSRVHDLRTRVAGRTVFIQLHLEMDGGMPLTRAHEVALDVYRQLLREYPNAEVIIHQDPAGIDEALDDGVHDIPARPAGAR